MIPAWLLASLVIQFNMVNVDNKAEHSARLYKDVQSYLAAREREFDSIPPERRALLKSMAGFAINCREKKLPVRFLFVCTHNSRRSQLAQIWTAAAAAYYELPVPMTYSGGTEATAFNPRAVAALVRAGMNVQKTTTDDNPVYHVRFGENTPIVTAFSKVLTNAPNPTRDFCAIMVCSHADQICPLVPGATMRIALPYDDPKESDDTPSESKMYDDCCRQIAREMLFAVSLIRASGR